MFRGMPMNLVRDMPDSISLRRSMFVCHNEREEYMDQMRMKRMRWDRTDNRTETDSDSFTTMSPALRHVDILENITMHLSAEDLLNCRLVCKHWSVEMAFFLFKRKSLIVADEHCRNNAEALLKKRSTGHPVSLSKLSLFNVEASGDLFQKLFSVFGVTLSNVSLEDCNLTPKDLSRMFLTNAPNIANLYLREGIKRRRSKISTLKEIKSGNNDHLLLPKMKVLHWDEEYGITDLKDVIDACPNLVDLELRNFPIPRSNQFKNLTWDSLTNLFLSPRQDLTDEHCKALTHLKLKLKNLTLFGVNASDKAYVKSLNKFLSTLTDTLEKLELWLDYASLLSVPRGVNFSPFPVHLPKVKRLLTESDIVGNINHLAKFPSLTELEIVSNSIQSQQHWNELTKRATIQQHSNLQSFRCGDIDVNSINKVMRAFPCITNLQVHSTHVNDIFLRSIVKGLTSLQELTVCSNMESTELRLTDSGITGIPAEFCKKFNRNPKQFETVDIDAVKTKPGISDLKLLHCLNFGLNNSEISDAAVVLGISSLTLLSVLKLPLCKITDASLDIVGEKLTKLVVLGIEGCRNVTPEAVNDLKNRKSGIMIESELDPALESMLRK